MPSDSHPEKIVLGLRTSILRVKLHAILPDLAVVEEVEYTHQLWDR